MGSKNPTQKTTQNQNSNTKYSGTSTVTPNSQVMPYYQTALADVSNAAATPYTPYTGDLTAMTNPYQQGVYSQIQGIPGLVNPYYQQAQQYMNNARVTAPQFSADQLQQFMNPFTQNVIDATRANMQQNNAVNDERLKGNAIAAGAWGGDRAGVARAEQMRDQSLSDNQTIAGLYQNNFDQAMQNYWTQAGMGMQADLANQQAALQSAGLQNQFANTDLNAQSTGAGLGMQAGTQQQQTQQAFLDALYNQWKIAQQYPFNTAQWEAELLPGLGGAMGSTTTSSGKSKTAGTGTSNTTLPAPNPLSQIVGAGLTAASFFNRGGAVPHAAGGGLFGDHVWLPGLGGWDWGSPGANAAGLIGSPSASSKSYQWTPEDLASWQDNTSTWVPEGSQSEPHRKWNDYNKGIANFGMSLMQAPQMQSTPSMDMPAPQIPQIQAQPIQTPQMPQNIQAPAFGRGGLIPHMAGGGLPYDDYDLDGASLSPNPDMMMPKGISPWDFDRAVRTAATETNSPQGQRNVVSVGKNRAAEADMGMASVFTAPKQFSVWNPDINTANNVSPEQWQKTAENILPTYTGDAPDATGGADHYHANYVNPDWAQGETPLGMGDDGHIFYKLGYQGGEPSPRPGLKPADMNLADVGDNSESYFDAESLARLRRPLSDSYNEMYQQLYGGEDKKSRMSNRQMALLAAGLGMMAGTSPYFGANVGAGGLAGVKMLSDLRGADDERESKVMQLAIQQRNDEMEAARWHAMMKHYQSQDETAANKAAATLSAGQKARDTAFAKDYVDWTTGGGAANVRSQLGMLQSSIDKLGNDDNISGPVIGTLKNSLPQGMSQYMFSDSNTVQQDIENVIQSSLRQVLGAQFTENEGVRLMQRTFNPYADEKVNMQRAKRLLKRIDEMAKAKDSAAQYFQDHDTLEGWDGVMPSLGQLDDLETTDDAGGGGDKPKKQPPSGAVAYLKAHPETRDVFEKRYGVSADQYLGGE